jgi:5-formyltetrahydrofolate cyclo-ligase
LLQFAAMGETYDEKRLIRRRMQQQRMRLSAAEVARCSTAACQRLLELPSFRAARHVVVYAAVGNEIDPMLIAERASDTGKTVYLPGGDADRFEFVGGPSRAEVLASTEAELLFVVPGVAFDEHGGRLGRGQGWYDRALARHPQGLRVALAYEFQLVPWLPQSAWDIRMHAVVTEMRIVGGQAKEMHS